MRWAGHVARMGEERGVYRVFVGKPEGKRPLERPRRRWVDNIRMDIQEVGCGYMDWIGLAHDRDRWRTFVSAVMNLRVPWNAGNLLTSCKPVSFSRRTLHHGVSKYLPQRISAFIQIGRRVNRNVNATFFMCMTEITNGNTHAKYTTELRRTVHGTGHAGRRERDYFMRGNPVILLFTQNKHHKHVF